MVRTDETTEHDVELGICIYCLQPLMTSEIDDCVLVGKDRITVHPECGEYLS